MSDATDNNLVLEETAPKRRRVSRRLYARGVILVVVVIIVSLVAARSSGSTPTQFDPDLISSSSVLQPGAQCPHPENPSNIDVGPDVVSSPMSVTLMMDNSKDPDHPTSVVRIQNCDENSIDEHTAVADGAFVYRVKPLMEQGNEASETNASNRDTTCNSPFWSTQGPPKTIPPFSISAYDTDIGYGKVPGSHPLDSYSQFAVCEATIKPGTRFVVSRNTEDTYSNARGNLLNGSEVLLASFDSDNASTFSASGNQGGCVPVGNQLENVKVQLYANSEGPNHERTFRLLSSTPIAPCEPTPTTTSTTMTTELHPTTSSSTSTTQAAPNATSQSVYSDTDAGCSTDLTFGFPEATGQITNESGETATYTVHVSFNDENGTMLASGFANVGPVPPGQTADWQARGPITPVQGVVDCPVTAVDVFPSMGAVQGAGSPTVSSGPPGGGSESPPQTTFTPCPSDPSLSIMDANCGATEDTVPDTQDTIPQPPNMGGVGGF